MEPPRPGHRANAVRRAAARDRRQWAAIRATRARPTSARPALPPGRTSEAFPTTRRAAVSCRKPPQAIDRPPGVFAPGVPLERDASRICAEALAKRTIACETRDARGKRVRVARRHEDRGLA